MFREYASVSSITTDFPMRIFCIALIFSLWTTLPVLNDGRSNTATVNVYVKKDSAQGTPLENIKVDALHKTNSEHNRTEYTNSSGLATFGDIYTIVKADDTNIPTGYDLVQNFPNPFNPSTTIRFGVARPIDVNVTIYNILGEQVKTLVSERVQPGFYQTEWDGTDESGMGVASGLYLATMKTSDGYVESVRMVLVDGGRGGGYNKGITRIGDASHLLKSIASGTAGEVYDFVATDTSGVMQQTTNPNVTVQQDTTFTMVMNEVQQQNTLEGVISGMFTNAAVEGATVTIDGKTGTTDNQGRFTIQGIDAGNYNASVSSNGFYTHNTSVAVSDGTTVFNDEIVTYDNNWMSFFDDVARRYGATQRWKTPSEGGVKPTFHVLTKTYDTGVDVSQERIDLVKEIITNDLNQFTLNEFGWTDANIVYHDDINDFPAAGTANVVRVAWGENEGPGYHSEKLNGNQIYGATVHHVRRTSKVRRTLFVTARFTLNFLNVLEETFGRLKKPGSFRSKTPKRGCSVWGWS